MEYPARNQEGSHGVSPLLKALREQKEARLKGGIYHRVQIELTYNSNHIEGSRLTHDQTRYIFETNTIGITDRAVNVDDIIETTNHFRAIDYMIDTAEYKLTENFVKHLHLLLKSGTSDERKDWFRVGDYKMLPNEVGGKCLVSRHVRGHGELESAFGTRGDDAAACPCDGNMSFSEISFVEYVGAKRLRDSLCHRAAFCDYKYIIHYFTVVFSFGCWIKWTGLCGRSHLAPL